MARFAAHGTNKLPGPKSASWVHLNRVKSKRLKERKKEEEEKKSSGPTYLCATEGNVVLQAMYLCTTEENLSVYYCQEYLTYYWRESIYY